MWRPGRLRRLREYLSNGLFSFSLCAVRDRRRYWAGTEGRYVDQASQVRNRLFAGGRWIRTFGSWSRDRQTVMGDGTAFSKTEADLFGNRKFESISLQRGVDCEPDFRGRILSMTVGPFFFLCAGFRTPAMTRPA